MARYETIKGTSCIPGMPKESAIRRLVKQQRCPGWYAGNRFFVNVDALAAMLEQKSMDTVNGGCNSFGQ